MNTYEIYKPMAVRNIHFFNRKARSLNNCEGVEMESNADKSIFLSVAKSILEGEYLIARELLLQAAANDIENPELYNLLAISYEKEGDRNKASRYYRVAYYMDQTFSAAQKNLERVCQFNYQGAHEIRWGIEIKEDEQC